MMSSGLFHNIAVESVDLQSLMASMMETTYNVRVFERSVPFMASQPGPISETDIIIISI